MCLIENEVVNVWKDYIIRIMNEENDCDRSVEGDAVEGPVDCVCRDEEVQSYDEMMTGSAPRRLDELLELIAVSV